jgi:hypothetical protein
MAGNIYLVQQDGQLVQMAEQAYDSEDRLQVLLARYPNLLAGDQMDDAVPRRWLLITREADVPDAEDAAGRWSVDHLFLDQDAIPTLVEVKRSSDTRIRREVVGQMLDYAANAVLYWPVERLQARFESWCQKADQDSDRVLESFLQGQTTPEAFWLQAKTNLQAGRVRLLFVADEIPLELQRVVEFLNRQMDPAEVLAVEVKQFVGEGITSLVPRVLGQTVEAQQKKASGSRPGRQWDEASVLQELANRRGSDVAGVAKQILQWAKDRQLVVWCGQGKVTGSVAVGVGHQGQEFAVFILYTDGSAEIQFKTLRQLPTFADDQRRLDLLGRLNQIPDVDIPADGIGRRPWLPMAALTQPAALQQFLENMDWLISRIQPSGPQQP